jgi:glutamate racemase
MSIGFFDSGIGGITVLHEALKQLPHENYIYYADTDHVPYGTKSKEEVKSSSLKLLI